MLNGNHDDGGAEPDLDPVVQTLGTKAEINHQRVGILAGALGGFAVRVDPLPAVEAGAEQRGCDESRKGSCG